MEEMGMTDLQYKSILKAIVSDLEEVRKKTAEPETIPEAIEKLDEMIQRFKSDIES